MDKKRNPLDPTGPLNHTLRVFLIDRAGNIRNIYSSGTLDPRLVLADVRTLMMESAQTSRTMKLAVMPKEPTWWVWLVTVVLLALGLAGFAAGFIAAIVLTFSQTLFFWRKHRSPRAIGVQIRLGYTLLLLVCFAASLRWLYWLPTARHRRAARVRLLPDGADAFAAPWNRKRAPDARPAPPHVPHCARRRLGRNTRACGRENGVCELEARIAALCARPHQSLTTNPNPT